MFCSASEKTKRQLKEDVKTALSFTENQGFKALNVELVNTDTQETIQVACARHEETEPSSSSETGVIKKMLFVKERFNVSNQSYHEMSMITDMPTSYSLSKAAKQLDSQYILRCTPGKVEGVQQSITECLRL